MDLTGPSRTDSPLYHDTDYTRAGFFIPDEEDENLMPYPCDSCGGFFENYVVGTEMCAECYKAHRQSCIDADGWDYAWDAGTEYDRRRVSDRRVDGFPARKPLIAPEAYDAAMRMASELVARVDFLERRKAQRRKETVR